MATSDDFKNVRTMEQVSTLLSFLYQNISAIEKVHYDLYLNPTAMYVDIERYDSEGNLTTESIPNLAQLRQITYSGAGEPNGVQSAAVGSIYIDTLTADIYYKSTDSDRFGWVLLRSTKNFVAAVDYLTPDGDGSLLTALNAGNIASGILPVVRGGTGVNSITGLLKGNGVNPFTVAEDGVDFMGPNTFTGVICYYPIDIIPSGWMRCDGSECKKETYPALYAIIGDKYNKTGSEAPPDDSFNVPDLLNYFIRCSTTSFVPNTIQQAQVGTHNHAIGGSTGNGTRHCHTKGTMRITGKGGIWFSGYNPNKASAQRVNMEGAFYIGTNGTKNRDVNDGSTGNNSDYMLCLDTDQHSGSGWSGETSYEASHTHSLPSYTSKNATATDGTDLENRVLNKSLVPIIKY